MGAPDNPRTETATPFLELNDLNSQGHAVGRQGWVGGVGGQEAAVFYNGTTVVTIGSPVGFCNGIRITENDRMRVLLNFGENVYDGATNSLTPFVGGAIRDLNALGWIAWEDRSGRQLSHIWT